MKKKEVEALYREVLRATAYIERLKGRAETRTSISTKKQLGEIRRKCWDLQLASEKEFEQQFYGNLSTYRDQAAALVAEATKIDRDSYLSD